MSSSLTHIVTTVNQKCHHQQSRHPEPPQNSQLPGHPRVPSLTKARQHLPSNHQPVQNKQDPSTAELIFQEFHDTITNGRKIHLSLTPYHEFKLPIFTMTINNQKMKVLFDSGSSVSLLTNKGRNTISPNLISQTKVRV